MSQKCRTLATIDRQYVDFDPYNPDHAKAFQMLCIGRNNDHFRQHPTLRFNVVEPFSDVRTMMFHKVAEAFIRNTKVAA